MKILFAASEAVPFIKTGGLGDVVGSLSLALKRAGHDVRVVLPKYRHLRPDIPSLRLLPLTPRVTLGGSSQDVQVYEASDGPRWRAYLVDSPAHFDREGIYGEAGGADYPDNDIRFILLSRAALEIAKATGFRPDAVHSHDWQTGMVPALLSTAYGSDPFFRASGSVFSIHNIAYQGVFSKETLGVAGLSWSEFTPDKMEFYDQVNFLKAGLAYSQVVSTVSPTYALETQTEEFGGGLDGFLRRRAGDYVGILNGLDTAAWNPAVDRFLAAPYTARSLGARLKCREDLQRATGLDVDPRAPLLAAVSRLDPQKGFDMLLEVLEEFVEAGCQAVFLGQGSRVYQASLQTLSRKHRGRVAASTEFNDPLAHKIYGGADLFLMPSRFEPCGLGQMIALRYGAVPVVTPTGGLRDTVAPSPPDGSVGIGFVAERVDTGAFRDALWRAVRLFREDRTAWRGLMRRGMGQPFGWNDSVRRYVELYRWAQSKKKLAIGPPAPVR